MLSIRVDYHRVVFGNRRYLSQLCNKIDAKSLVTDPKNESNSDGNLFRRSRCTSTNDNNDCDVIFIII